VNLLKLKVFGTFSYKIVQLDFIIVLKNAFEKSKIQQKAEMFIRMKRKLRKSQTAHMIPDFHEKFICHIFEIMVCDSNKNFENNFILVVLQI
jgi:hypothetical protein